MPESLSWRADYTSALDKIADNKEAGAAAGAGAGGGLLAAAADYVHHGARSVADTAHGYTHEGDRVSPLQNPRSCLYHVGRTIWNYLP